MVNWSADSSSESFTGYFVRLSWSDDPLAPTAIS